MSYISGINRSQEMLLPERLDDYVSPDHPVRFIDAFVDGLDLGRSGFVRMQPAKTGRPGYAPADLLKLYIWGYLNQVRSSRRLERECGRNLEAIWMLGKLRPDFKTIADFRKDNLKAFRAVFREFNLICREMSLFGKELAAIDGTKIKAVNNPARCVNAEKLQALIKRIDTQVEKYLSELDSTDQKEAHEKTAGQTPSDSRAFQKKIEALQKKQKRYQEALVTLEKSGSQEICLTDPESRRMWKVGVGYNVQIAVDAKHKLIAEQEVVQDPTDHGQLQSMALMTKESLGIETLKVVADGGYYDNVQIADCEKINVETYVPRPKKGSAEVEGRFGKGKFSYDAAADCYHCPGGAKIKPGSKFQKHGEPHTRYSNPSACGVCQLKEQCTKGPFRSIDRWDGEAALDQMHARTEANPDIIRKRKALVEHPFGTLKFWMNQSSFLMRGLEKVRAEFSLSALVYNLKRALNILGVKKLIETHALQKGVLPALGTLNSRPPDAKPLGFRPPQFHRGLKILVLRLFNSPSKRWPAVLPPSATDFLAV